MYVLYLGEIVMYDVSMGEMCTKNVPLSSAQFYPWTTNTVHGIAL